MLEIIISLIAISSLIILHELGHYLVAKRYNVKVEEFGMGLPPRLYGKKIGETIWSLNWIPFGGFVRMHGEEPGKFLEKNRSFNAKPIYQRMLIVAAGCLIFWLLAFLIFFSIFSIGTIVDIDDDQYAPDAVIQIIQVEKNFPAYKAGIKPGDIIKSITVDDEIIQINKKFDLRYSLKKYERIVEIEIQRVGITYIKEVERDYKESKIGIGFARIIQRDFPIYEAIPMAAERTVKITYLIGESLPKIPGAIGDLIKGRDPAIAGPVRIVEIMGERLELNISSFFNFLALISINLAIINLLPIPGLDGGKLVFLAYEGIRKKPFPQKIETYLAAFFLIMLLGLMFIITIREIYVIL